MTCNMSIRTVCRYNNAAGRRRVVDTRRGQSPDATERCPPVGIRASADYHAHRHEPLAPRGQPDPIGMTRVYVQCDNDVVESVSLYGGDRTARRRTRAPGFRSVMFGTTQTSPSGAN